MGTVHTDWTDADYFNHPALSHSDTKLLDPPAVYRWVKDNNHQTHKPEYDFGHVVHELVLGVGPGIVVIEADNWRTKAAKEERDDAHATGRAPILVDDYLRANACAEAVRQHPIADKLLDHATHLEIGMSWHDDGVERKAKLDAVSGRFGIDVKTTERAATDAFGRSAGKFGYATQAAWYRDALVACCDIEEPGFLFVVVEKSPPHLVNVIQLDPYDVDLGAKRNRQRIDLYRRCRDADEWPGYGDGINEAQLPRWAELAMETE